LSGAQSGDCFVLQNQGILRGFEAVLQRLRIIVSEYLSCDDRVSCLHVNACQRQILGQIKALFFFKAQRAGCNDIFCDAAFFERYFGVGGCVTGGSGA